MVPTGWWPTAVSVDPTDGTIFALTGRGHGIGADAAEYAVSAANEALKLTGSIQAIAPPDAPTLATYTQTVTTENQVYAEDGYPTVQCNGAPYDFPVPLKPEDGAKLRTELTAKHEQAIDLSGNFLDIKLALVLVADRKRGTDYQGFVTVKPVG